MAPLVSVILPVRDGRRTVGAAIASVLAQSHRDFELIVIDDGSTDGTAAVVRACQDPRLRVIELPVNRGAAAARNHGLAAAVGAFIAFIDADDEWMADKLACQVATFLSLPPTVGLVTTGYRFHRVVTGHVKDCVPQARRDWLAEHLNLCSLSPGSTLMARRAVFQEIGGFDDRLRRFEDWDWLLSYFASGQLVVMSEILAVIHNGFGPPPAIVDEAVSIILAKHVEPIAARRGWRAARRLRASMALEQARAQVGAGRYHRALGHLVRAAAIWPPRFADLLRGLARRTLNGDVAWALPAPIGAPIVPRRPALTGEARVAAAPHQS